MMRELVLTFHGVGEPEVCGADFDPEMWIPHERFLELLGAIPPEVIITFDDGFASCWELAIPALQERGLKAHFFVTEGKLGSNGYLSLRQVKDISLAGMTIGSHGMRHRPWRKLDGAALHEEIFEAKERIEAIIGTSVTEAACPFGAYDRRALNALKRSGIERVYTSDRAIPISNSWIIPRYTIRRSDTEKYLEEVVRGLHDASLIGKVKMFVKRFR